MHDDDVWGLIVVVFSVLMFIFGWLVGDRRVGNQALEHGYAEYESTTGEWQWKKKASPQ
jgi:hypothetical protein